RAIALFRQFGEAYYGLAQSLRALGRRDEARAALEQHRGAGRGGPPTAPPPPPPALPQAHANLISLYGRAGQWAKAEQHYKAVLALGYNVDEAHYNYGVLLGSQQRWSEAAAAYRLAVAANPLHAQALNNLGQLLEGERHLGGD